MPMRSPRLNMSGLVRSLSQDREDALRMALADQAQAMQVQGQGQRMFEGMMDDDAAARRAGDARTNLAMRLASDAHTRGAEGARKSKDAEAMRGTLKEIAGIRANATLNRPVRPPAPRAPARPQRDFAGENRQKAIVEAAKQAFITGRQELDAARDADGRYNQEAYERAMPRAAPYFQEAQRLFKEAGVPMPPVPRPEAPPPPVAPAQEADDGDEDENALNLLMGR